MFCCRESKNPAWTLKYQKKKIREKLVRVRGSSGRFGLWRTLIISVHTHFLVLKNYSLKIKYLKFNLEASELNFKYYNFRPLICLKLFFQILFYFFNCVSLIYVTQQSEPFLHNYPHNYPTNLLKDTNFKT